MNVNETLKSVVLVQYKVMKGTGGEKGYRPNSQLEEKIKRMDRVSELLARADCDSYRLGYEPFFLKFCESVLEHQDSGMVPGHYLPLGFWKLLAVDSRVKGPRGGVRITPSNLPRYFTATDFKDLVARGWVGTTGLAAEVIVPLIQEIMESGRTVALAIKSERPEPEPELDDELHEEDSPAGIASGFPRWKRRRPGQKPRIIEI
jgi:hypothetical protein